MDEGLLQRAREVMPGGVNSPVRAFKAVGREPLFIRNADGSKIYDISGRQYIDYVCSWGPMLLGHNNRRIQNKVRGATLGGLSFGAPTEREVELAEAVIMAVPSIEMVRMVGSGTEAVMSAIRLARGFTGRKKIIKFSGCYHGHSDCMLVSAGSGALTFSQPDSLGVTPGAAADTLIAEYNDVESVKALFSENPGEVAAVIIEPVAANMGVVPPKEGFLNELREITTENGALLIFDEVITGFRLAIGGAQEYYGVNADIVTFGKIIGGGMPVGAYGARKEIMELVAPLGGVYQAGTLSGNPIAMAAGLEQINILLEIRDTLYPSLERTSLALYNGLSEVAERLCAPVTLNRVGSLICMFFTKGAVDSFKAAKESDTALYARYFGEMLDRGIYLAPAQFEAMFVSGAHTAEDIKRTVAAAEGSLAAMKNEGCF